MSSAPRRILLCHDCCAVLADDDAAHYVYQCHDCVMLEHGALLAAASDPDHPDAARLAASAVDLLAVPPRGTEAGDLAAALRPLARRLKEADPGRARRAGRPATRSRRLIA